MVPEEVPLLPDAAAIRLDLEYMTARWHLLPEDALIELRAFKEDMQPQTVRYAHSCVDDAVEWAESMNELGYNLYAVRNPIRSTCAGSASDGDILATFFLWADCDDGDAASNVKRWGGPKYHAAVVTGMQPGPRVHTYWELAEPCYDLAAWRQCQEAIAAHFGSDRTVVNPSRIMRIGGTVSYPFRKKRERGYTREVVTVRTEYPDERPRVTLEQMQRAFGSTPSALQGAPAALQIDTGPRPLDRERARIQALSGQEWHSAVIRLVASYVSKGLSDDEIHGLTAPLTLSGYTTDQTAAEVQTAIDGARRKGWTPEPEYAEPNFDAPAPAAAAPAPVEWFDDIEPALADAYIVKSVIAQESMSVTYGPSNSGKTFFALDLAFHIAIGRQWRGHRVRQSAVLYLAAEGGRGVANRIAALKMETGARDVPLALRRAGMDLLHDQADLQAVYDLAKDVARQKPGLPIFIVIDTLSRVMAGGDENSAADMTALIRNIDAIRAATNAHVMLVHHTGKDTARGARGHSSLRAATDTEIEVANEDGGRAAMVTKQRDYQGGEVFAFELKSVTLGRDQDGDEVTSCVVEHVDSEDFQAARKAAKGRGKNQQIIMEAFDQMVAEGLAKGNPGGVGMPEPGQFWAVETAELRRIAQGKMAGENSAKLFRTAWEALSAPGGVFVAGNNLAWRIDRRKSK